MPQTTLHVMLTLVSLFCGPLPPPRRAHRGAAGGQTRPCHHLSGAAFGLTLQPTFRLSSCLLQQPTGCDYL